MTRIARMAELVPVRKRVGRIRLFFLFFCLGFRAASAAPFVLVEDGRAVSTIVIGAQADAREKKAASELQDMLERMSGAEVPIKTDSEALEAGAASIHIGRNAYVARLGIRWDEEAFDNFAIRTVDDRNLVIAGKNGNSTLFAVCDFLEKYCGVRWFMPADSGIGEVVPARKTIAVTDIDNFEVPSFAVRIPFGGNYYAYEVHKQKMRHYVDMYSHNLSRIVVPRKYAPDRPEYYPFINGARRVPPLDGSPGELNGWQPCTTNPEVIRLCVEAAIAYFRKHPGYRSFSVGVNDGEGFCQCDACRALDTGQTYPDGRESYSDRYFTFVNAVAAELENRCPGKYIGCIAYGRMGNLPPLKVRVRPNVIVYRTHNRPGILADFEAWSKVCSRMGLYDYYYGTGYVVPRHYPHAIEKVLKTLHARGVDSFYAEAYSNWIFDAPKLYVASRLLWNINLVADDILDDFYRSFYAEAAAPVKAFFERCEAAWDRQGAEKPFTGDTFYGPYRNVRQLAMYSLQDIDACEAHLATAREMARDEVVRKRVALLSKAFHFAGLQVRIYQYTRQLGERTIGSEAQVREALALSGELLKAIREKENYFATVIATEPYAVVHWKKTMTPTEYMTRIEGQPKWALVSGARQAVFRGCNAISDWYRDSGRPEAALALWQNLAADRQDGRLADYARAQMALDRLGAAGGRNLIGNPGFEEVNAVNAVDEFAAKLEWQVKEAPFRWSRWKDKDDSAGVFVLSRQTKRGGEYAVGIKGAKNAAYTNKIPVVAGGAYLFKVWARAAGLNVGSRVAVSVRWLDANGWLPREAYNAELRGSGQWEQVRVFFVAPDGALQACLLLGASDLGRNGQVWFDDASLVELN